LLYPDRFKTSETVSIDQLLSAAGRWLIQITGFLANSRHSYRQIT